jgi:dihydrofolate reductase
MDDAKQAAGGKDVLVHGADIVQGAPRDGLLDQLAVHLVPVPFGEGRRLFEHLGVEHRELERVRVLEGESGVVHLRFAVGR